MGTIWAVSKPKEAFWTWPLRDFGVPQDEPIPHLRGLLGVIQLEREITSLLVH